MFPMKIVVCQSGRKMIFIYFDLKMIAKSAVKIQHKYLKRKLLLLQILLPGMKAFSKHQLHTSFLVSHS